MGVMKMTEDEAKQTICPFMSFGAFNVDEVMCRASKCQMWVTSGNENRATGKKETYQREDGQYGIRAEYAEVLLGYCGLGGKP